MVRVDVIGLDEVVQKLQVRWLKGLILTIGPSSLRVIVNKNHFTTQSLINPHHFEKNIEGVFWTTVGNTMLSGNFREFLDDTVSCRSPVKLG